MAERFLIDTSAIIKYLNATFPDSSLQSLDELIDTESLISFVTEIELRAWNPGDPDDLLVYNEFIAGSHVVGIDSNIINETVRIRKQYRIKLPDALIAATALVNNFTLIADNDKDYGKVPDLKYFNPAKVNGNE